MSGARFLGRIDAINGSKGAMEGKGAGEIKFFFWLCLHKRIRTVELAATTIDMDCRMVMHALSATSMRRQSAICCWAVRSALSRQVWFLILGSFGLVNMMPNPEDEILEWGLLQRSRVGEMLSSAFDSMMLLLRLAA